MARKKTDKQIKGEDYLKKENRLETLGTRKGFWDDFKMHRGSETMPLVDLHKKETRTVGGHTFNERVYARDIPTTYNALEIWNLAVKSGVNPTEFIMKTQGLERKEARHRLEYQANKIAYDTGQAKLLLEKGQVRFSYVGQGMTPAEARSKFKMSGLTKRTAEYIVTTRELLSQGLRKDLTLRAGQKAYTIVRRDGKIDPNSKRHLSGLGTWRDDPRWTPQLGLGSSRVQAPEETYEDDADDADHAVDFYVKVVPVSGFPDRLSPADDPGTKAAVARTNRIIGRDLSQVHSLKGKLANVKGNLHKHIQEGFKDG